VLTAISVFLARTSLLFPASNHRDANIAGQRRC
jgi:hypothetical protein